MRRFRLKIWQWMVIVAILGVAMAHEGNRRMDRRREYCERQEKIERQIASNLSECFRNRWSAMFEGQTCDLMGLSNFDLDRATAHEYAASRPWSDLPHPPDRGRVYVLIKPS